jgi:hypothetical protein
MKKTFLLILAGYLSIPAFEQTKKYNIVDFGAKGDGKTLNTESIQKAIDKVSSDGGGQLVVPDGNFLTGTLVLKSGVNLYLSPKAVLLGSIDPYDYPYVKDILDKKHVEAKGNRIGALIGATDQINVSITGSGTIDGQGRRLALIMDSLFYAGKLDTAHYNLRRKRPEARPGDFKFTNCSNLSITGITIKNACGWVQTYERCKNLTLDHIRVESDAYWNNDGIDVVDCSKVRITNSFVNSADDGICLKSDGGGFYNDSIYVANCTVRSSASAVKFGTASTGGFRNVVIKDIKVFDTFRSAIAIESVDGGMLENVLVDGITATNTGNAIFIRLGHRNKDEHVGTLKNIVIRNVKVEVPFGRPDEKYDLRGPDLAFFHNIFPSSIVGIPGHPVQNVTLENIQIIYPGKGNDGLAILPLFRLKDVPEVENQYPEFSMFGELPAWGFYVRHVEGLTLKNVTVIAKDKDYRPAYVFDDVNGLNMTKCIVKENDKDKQFILNNVSNENLDVDKNLVQKMGQ